MSGGSEVSIISPLGKVPGVSGEAVRILEATPLLDLHIDTFIPPRLVGYDLHKRHGQGVLHGRFFGHLDFPRVKESSLNGAMWSITTNPFRGAASRWRVFLKNLERFRGLIRSTEGELVEVRTAAGLTAALAKKQHAVLFSIQGGNAIAAAPDGVRSIPDNVVVRVTLVHLTSSVYGVTSSPLRWGGGKRGLTKRGVEFVEQLNERRVFVDLAHINRPGFWDAVAAHDRHQPLVATHTGVCGVREHWRNLDDSQIRAIAETGGVVGIIFAGGFLRRKGGPRDQDMIIEHLEHLINVGGEGVAALGSDYDGAITPPKGMRNGTHYVRLVEAMLSHGWRPDRIERVLGGNFIRAFKQLRPD